MAYPFRIATQLQYYVKREKCRVNDVIFPSGCEACAINLGNKNMKIGIFTGGTSVRSKNIFTDISRYPTGKHEINVLSFSGPVEMKPIYFVLVVLFIESGFAQHQRFLHLGRWRNPGTSNNVRRNTLMPNQITRSLGVRQRLGQGRVQGLLAQRNTIGLPQRPQLTQSNLLQRRRTLQSQKIFRPGVSSLPRDADGNVLRPVAFGRRVSSQSRPNTRTRSRVADRSRPSTQGRLDRLAQQTTRQHVDTALQIRRRSQTISSTGRREAERNVAGTRSSRRNKRLYHRPSSDNFDPAVFDEIAMTRRMTRKEVQNTSGSGFRGSSPTVVRHTSGRITSSQQQRLSRLNEAENNSAISNSITSPLESGRTLQESFQNGEIIPSSRQLGIVAPRETITNRETTREFHPPNPEVPNTPKTSIGQYRLSREVNAILHGNIDRLSQSSVGRVLNDVENQFQDPSLRRSVTAERNLQTPETDRSELTIAGMVQRRLSDRPRQRTQGQNPLTGDNEISSDNTAYENHINYQVRALLNGEKVDFSQTPSLRKNGPNNPSIPKQTSRKPLFMVPTREIVQSQISRTPLRADNNLQFSQDNRLPSSSRIQDNSLFTPSRRNFRLDNGSRRQSGSWDDVLNAIDTQEQQAASQSPFEDVNKPRVGAYRIPAGGGLLTHRANTSNEAEFWWETLGLQENRTISKKLSTEQIIGSDTDIRGFGNTVRRADTETFPFTIRAPRLWSVQRNKERQGQTISKNVGRSQGRQTERSFENIPSRVHQSQMNELNLGRKGAGTKGQTERRVDRFQGRSSDNYFDESVRSEADSVESRWASINNTNSSFQWKQLDIGQVDGSSSRQVGLGFGRTSRKDGSFDNVQSDMSEDQKNQQRRKQVNFSKNQESGSRQIGTGFDAFRHSDSESQTAKLDRRRPELAVNRLSQKRLTDPEIDRFQSRTSTDRLQETGLRRSNDRILGDKQSDRSRSNAFERLINKLSSDQRSDQSQTNNFLGPSQRNLPENDNRFLSTKSQEFRPSLPTAQQGSPTLSEIQTGPDRISFSLGRNTNPLGPENDLNGPIRSDSFARVSGRTLSASGNDDQARRLQSQNSANDRDDSPVIRRSEPPKMNSEGGFDLDLFLKTLQTDRSSSQQQPLISNSNGKRFSKPNEQSQKVESGLDFQRFTVELGTNNRLDNTDLRKRTNRGFASEGRENERPRRLQRTNDAVDVTSTDGIELRSRTGQDNLSDRQNGLSRLNVPLEDMIGNTRNRLGSLDSVIRGIRQNSEEIQEFNLTSFLQSIWSSDTPSDPQVSNTNRFVPGSAEVRRDRPQNRARMSPFESPNRINRERIQMHDSPFRGNENSINDTDRLFDIQPTIDFTNRPRSRNSDNNIMFNRPRLQQQDPFNNVQRRADSSAEDRSPVLGINPPASNQRQSDNMLNQNTMNVPTTTAWLAEREAVTTSGTSARSELSREQPRNTDIRANLANQNQWQETSINTGQTTTPPLSSRLRQADNRTNNVFGEISRHNSQGRLMSDSTVFNRQQRRNTTEEFDLQAFLASLGVTQIPTSTTVSTTTTQILNSNDVVVSSDPISDPSLRLELNALNLGDTAPFSFNSQISPPIRQSLNNNDFNKNNEGKNRSQQDTGDSSFLSDLLGLDIANNILPMGNNVINEIPTPAPTSNPVFSRMVSTTPKLNTQALIKALLGGTNSSATQNSKINSAETREIRISLDGVQSQRNSQNRSPTLIVLQIGPDGTVVNNTENRNPPTEKPITPAEMISPIIGEFLPPTSPVPSTTQTIPSTHPTTTTPMTTTRIIPGTTDVVLGLRAQLNRQNSLLQELLNSVTDKGTGSKITKMQDSPREADTPKRNTVLSLEDSKDQERPRILRQLGSVNRLNQQNAVNKFDSGNTGSLMIQPEGLGASRDIMNVPGHAQKPIPTSGVLAGQIIRNNGPENKILAMNRNTPSLQNRVGDMMGDVQHLISSPNRASGHSQNSHSPMVLLPNQAQAGGKHGKIRYNLNSESNDAIPLSQQMDATFPLNIQPEVVALRAAFNAALFDKLAMTRTMAPSIQRSRTVHNRLTLPYERLSASNNERRGPGNSGIQWLGGDGSRQHSQRKELLSSQMTRDSVNDFARESPRVSNTGINDVRLAGVEVQGIISKSLNDLQKILPTLPTPSSTSDSPDASPYDIPEGVSKDLKSEELNIAMRNLLDKVGHDRAVDIMKDFAKLAIDRSNKIQRDMGTNSLRTRWKKPMGVRIRLQNPNMLSHLLQSANVADHFPLIARTTEPTTTAITSPTSTVRSINVGLVGDSGPLLEKLIQARRDIRLGKKRQWQQLVNGERMNMQTLDLSTLNGRFHPVVKDSTDSKNLHKTQLYLRNKGMRKPLMKQILGPKIPRLQKKPPKAKGQTLWAAPMYYHVTTTISPTTTKSKESASKMNYLKQELSRLMGLFNTMEV